MAFDFIKENIKQQQQLSLYRQRTCIQSKGYDSVDSLPRIIVDGKSFINFSSNDYLGLNHHKAINLAMQEGIDKFGLSGCSSNLVTGFNYAHQALEDKICQWLNTDNCLLFSSGFAANMALFNTLGQNKDCHFFLDKLSHASMIDGAYSSNAIVKRFAHNNVKQLTDQLSKTNSLNKLIGTESIFSMDGDQAELKALAKISKQHQAKLFVDDAHAIGVLGEKGEGSHSLISPDICMATFGKAIATSGAFLSCDKATHEYLINFARHYIYSTAISPAMAWATIKSIDIIQTEQWRRDKINALTELLIQHLDPKIKIIKSQSSIQAIIIGDEKIALDMSQKLKNSGFWLTAIRPPTVAKGTSRLRVTICSNHKSNDIIMLAKSLNRAISE